MNVTTRSHSLTIGLPEKSAFADAYTTGCAARDFDPKILSVPDPIASNLAASNIKAAVARTIIPIKMACDIAATLPGELTNNRKGVSGGR